MAHNIHICSDNTALAKQYIFEISELLFLFLREKSAGNYYSEKK